MLPLLSLIIGISFFFNWFYFSICAFFSTSGSTNIKPDSSSSSMWEVFFGSSVREDYFKKAGIGFGSKAVCKRGLSEIIVGAFTVSFAAY